MRPAEHFDAIDVVHGKRGKIECPFWRSRGVRLDAINKNQGVIRIRAAGKDRGNLAGSPRARYVHARLIAQGICDSRNLLQLQLLPGDDAYRTADFRGRGRETIGGDDDGRHLRRRCRWRGRVICLREVRAD